MDELILGAIWYVVLIFSLTFHEAGHAWAAMRGGDLTAYLGGQVSLDPMPHIRREPFGTVLVPLLSYAFSGFMIGWASTPYDPRWAAAHPRRAGWMSLAGPAANLILVLAAGTAIRFGMMIDVFYAPGTILFTQVVGANPNEIWGSAATLLSVTFTLNLLLLVFNLIPLAPLDGSRILAGFVPPTQAEAYARLQNNGPVILIGLIMLDYMLGLGILWGVIGPVVGLLTSLAIGY